MRYAKIDNPPKKHISHRVLRGHGEDLFKSFMLPLRSLRLCLPCETFVALISLGARPTPLNRVLPLVVFLSFFLTPLNSCNAKDEASPDLADNVILDEDWEKRNFKNWDDDFNQGDTTIDTDPVFAGEYAVKQRASNPGSLVHFFGDHPGVDKEPVEDITLETYLYFPPGFQWPSDGMTLWTFACFEGWEAGYNKAKGSAKPLAWAPYYIMIALKGNGEPLAFLTRADELGGTGELYKQYKQNIGETKPIELGTCTKLKFRLKLNTPGKVDGIFQLWMDDELKCNYSNVDFRGSYHNFGWNHLMMSFLGSPSQSDGQWISRDNILLTREQAPSVPMVRKKIIKKPPPPKAVAESDQPPVDPPQEKRPVREPPTGLSIVAAGGSLTSNLTPLSKDSSGEASRTWPSISSGCRPISQNAPGGSKQDMD